MHSRLKLWDLKNFLKKKSMLELEGVFAISSFDSMCLKILKDEIITALNNPKMLFKSGSEVNKSWIEDEFINLNLFSNVENFFIHQAQDLSAELIDSFCHLSVSGRLIILSFENEQSGWKKIQKSHSVETLAVDAPSFWENNKLLDFVCDHLQVGLDSKSKAWVLDILENNLSSFYQACMTLRLNFPGLPVIDYQKVKTLLEADRLDHFNLATLFSQKKKTEFFEKIFLTNPDFEKMRSLASFMQSHLIKLLDTSYLSARPKLNNYEKQLLSYAKNWTEAELNLEIKNFNNWEILAKKKDHHLWQDLKSSYLEATLIFGR